MIETWTFSFFPPPFNKFVLIPFCEYRRKGFFYPYGATQGGKVPRRQEKTRRKGRNWLWKDKFDWISEKLEYNKPMKTYRTLMIGWRMMPACRITGARWRGHIQANAAKAERALRYFSLSWFASSSYWASCSPWILIRSCWWWARAIFR